MSNLNYRATTGLLVVVFALSACGPAAQMKKAQKLEKNGKAYEAWQVYQKVAAKNPKSELAPEALFRAGWLAQRGMKDCHAAAVFYDRVLQSYPQADPWSRLSANQKTNCPDYFPLVPGFEWVEGDSETAGKNARVEVVCKNPPGKDALPSEAGLIEKTYFAGTSKFKTTGFIYKKVDGDVQEFPVDDDLRAKVIFKIPAVVGTRWKTVANNRAFFYEVAAVDKTVKVEAGEFANCVLIQSRIEGVPGSTNEYYAPYVGKVLTAFATPQGEKRNTELLSYKPASEIDFKAISHNP